MNANAQLIIYMLFFLRLSCGLHLPYFKKQNKMRPSLFQEAENNQKKDIS